MRNVHELMEEFKNLKKEFIDRKLFLAGQLGVLDKEINVLIKNNAYQEEDIEKHSLELCSKLKELELKRREIKEELKIISDIDENNKFSYHMLGYTINEYEKVKRVISMLNEETKNKNQKVHSISIWEVNPNEVDKTYEALKAQYDKVFIDHVEKKIFYYNNCRAM